MGRTSTLSDVDIRPRRRFKSSRLVGEFEKPWLADAKKTANWDSITFYSAIFAALCIGAYFCYSAYAAVPKNEYCLILDDQFKTLDSSIWSHEIQVDGYGTGSFDWTTNDPANSYVDDEGLHIVPTLTLESTDITDAQLLDGYTLNLTRDGTCTSSNDQQVYGNVVNDPCIKVSNITSDQIINPVRSARLTTAGKKTIRYGRVEISAKMPAGDWLWPAIWMMPQDSVYGDWPRSGEIDLAESRGNDAEHYILGNNQIGSALHWGASYSTDMIDKTKGNFAAKRTKYSDGFHTYGLEWSEKYLFIWLDGRLRQVIFLDFTKIQSFWKFGGFSSIVVNGTSPDNPWVQSENANAPFDQEFYLILNVAVGAGNGYFPDSYGNKPWADKSDNAMKQFWAANTTWLPTWGAGPARGMTVKYVKMWQEGKC